MWKLFHRGETATTSAADKAREADATPAAPPAVVGLALGGGAVRGAAHAGVLSVFEREGIRPDVIAGTSAGAVVGAAWAAGVSASEILEAFRQMKWHHLARPSWNSKLSMFDTNPLGTLVGQYTHCDEFADLQVRFAAVASDIVHGTTVVMTEGPLAEAVVASAAIPGLFEPVRRDGRLLVDGGVTDNLPVDAARELGADYVIAVDIMPPLDGSYEPTDISDMAMLAFTNVQRVSELGRDDADLVITPNVVHVSLSDFSQAQVAYDAGVRAAEAALPELLRDLRR